MRHLDIFDNTLYIFSSALYCLYNDNISFSKCFQIFCNSIIHNLNTSNCYSTSYALGPQPYNLFAQIHVHIAYLFLWYAADNTYLDLDNSAYHKNMIQ